MMIDSRHLSPCWLKEKFLRPGGKCPGDTRKAGCGRTGWKTAQSSCIDPSGTGFPPRLYTGSHSQCEGYIVLLFCAECPGVSSANTTPTPLVIKVVVVVVEMRCQMEKGGRPHGIRHFGSRGYRPPQPRLSIMSVPRATGLIVGPTNTINGAGNWPVRPNGALRAKPYRNRRLDTGSCWWIVWSIVVPIPPPPAPLSHPPFFSRVRIHGCRSMAFDGGVGSS